MFEKLSSSQPAEQKESQLEAKTAALIRAVRERSGEYPLIGAKPGVKEVFQRLIDGMKNEKAVHLESLLCALGALAGGAAQHAGAKELPDFNEIFQYTSTVIGSDQFGIPRVPENHRASDTPINYLNAIWPRLFPTVRLFCPSPVDWPILYGLAVQEAIDAGKSAIDPALALRIVMESAIPMSKVDLASS